MLVRTVRIETSQGNVIIVRYEWSDALNLYAGVHGFMANNSSSRFGAVDRHDLVYVRVRYGF